MSNILKVGDKVKIICCCDNNFEWMVQHIGSIGIVTDVKDFEDNGFLVKFLDNEIICFPEEIEKIAP